MNNKKRSLDQLFVNQIRIYFLLPFVVVVVIIILVSAYFSSQYYADQQMNLSQAAAFIVDDYLLQAQDAIMALSSQVETKEPLEITNSMEVLRTANPTFTTLLFLDEDGIVRALYPLNPYYLGFDLSRQPFFLQKPTDSGVSISKPFTSLFSGQPTVYMSQVVPGKGLVVGELNLNALQQATLKLNTVSHSGVLMVADRSGTLLAHSNAALVAEKANIASHSIFRKGLVEDTSSIYRSGSGFYLGSSSLSQRSGWLVIVESPVTSVYGLYIWLGLVAILLSLLMVTLLLRNGIARFRLLISKPVTQLIDLSQSLAEGDYAKTIRVRAPNASFIELNALFDRFLQMREMIREREDLLRKSESHYRRLVEFSPDAILVHTNEKILFANESAVKLYAARDKSQLRSHPIEDLIAPEYREVVNQRYQNLADGDLELLSTLNEQVHIRLNGDTFYAEVNDAPVIFHQVKAFQTTIRNVSDKKMAFQRLQYLANYDTLTEVANRGLLQQHLELAIENAHQGDYRMAVMVLDLDNFKWINDAFGHPQGDRVLKSIARLMESSLRKNTLVARLGGDEFAVMIEQIGSDEDLAALAKRLLRTIAQPMRIGDQDYVISVSLGISIYPQDAKTVSELINCADAAMYHSKRAGKNTFSFYTSEIKEQSLEKLTVVSQLSHAIKKNELHLVYQPQVELKSNEIVGVEALLRWRHPAYENISPSIIIQLAEEYGLINEIGEWVFTSALAQQRIWLDAGFSELKMAVNISEYQVFNPQFLQFIEHSIEEYRIPPHLIELEWTENSVFQKLNKKRDVFEQLKQLGVRLAIDDFGTGYSTFSQLAHYPFDVIKIDRSLSSNVVDHPREARIVAGIIQIANNLNMQVLAEGVEQQDQLEFYIANHCDLVQGWYFSRDVTPQKLEALLANGVHMHPASD